MARRYVRDARGRFASKGYSGQTGGRGARLKGSGKKREGGGAVVQPKRAGEIKGTISKSSSKRRINANSRIAERQIAKDVASRANTISPPVQRRGDTASVNVSMSGSRGRRLDAEISRNVKQQKTTARAADKSRNIQFKADQSRAKALRGKYGDQLAKDFAAKSGRKVSEVKATIKGMPPSQQVKLLTKAGREQRAKANLARTADTRNQPGSSMIRRPTQKMTRGNLRAERALEFYKDPKKALKSVNKTRRGFRLPRGMR